MTQFSSHWLEWCKEYKKTAYTETLELTHKFFEQGLTIKKIAKKREVKSETIERQIIALIVKGLIHVNDVIKKKVKKEILEILETNSITTLSEIKNLVSENISWFEIKCVIASFGVKADKK